MRQQQQFDPNDIDNVAAFGLWPNEYPDSGTFEMLGGVFNAARQIEREFRERLGQLRSSGTLTDLGVKQELTAFAAQELDRLDRATSKTLARAKAEHAELTTKLRGVPLKDADSAARAIREVEVRAQLLAMDEPARIAVLSDAIERGEEIVALAYFNAPLFIQRRIISIPDLMTQAHERWDDVRSPEVAREVRRLGSAIEAATRAVKTVQTMILRSGDIDVSTSAFLGALARDAA